MSFYAIYWTNGEYPEWAVPFKSIRRTKGRESVSLGLQRNIRRFMRS